MTKKLNIKIKLIVLSLLFVGFIGSAQNPTNLIKKDWSELTQKLYDTLLAIKGNGIFFGMQHATGYGVGWNNDNNRSDIKSITGDYPAFGGWGVSFKHNNIAKGEGFEAARYKIKLFHNMGGFNTMEWHADNPFGGDCYWKRRHDKTKNMVASIMPGGEKHQVFLTQPSHNYDLLHLKRFQN